MNNEYVNYRVQKSSKRDWIFAGYLYFGIEHVTKDVLKNVCVTSIMVLQPENCET